MTSVRARIMRRLVERAGLADDLTLDERRQRMERPDRLPRPRRVVYDEEHLAGTPILTTTPTDVPPLRHVLYLHGGGYCLGSPTSHVGMVARLAKRAGAVAILPDYRLAPEHPYPAAVDDCVAVYRALLEEIDPTTLAIAGDSAGGGAALATLCRLRDAGDPLPAASYLLSPWTDLTASGNSMTAKADADPMLRETFLREAAGLYAAATPLDDPGLSPIFADLTGLPPTLIQTGTDEILLDDTTRLAERLEAAGVDVTVEVADDLWHVYPAFAGFMPEATAALVRAGTFLRSRLLPTGH